MKYVLYHPECPDGREFGIDTAVIMMNQGWTEGKPNAIEKRQKSENNIGEHIGACSFGSTAETSDSHSDEPSREIKKKGGWPKGKKRKT